MSDIIRLAEQEHVNAIGHDNHERAWICSDRDAWYPNPFYTGPRMPHPEDDGAHDYIDAHGIDAWRALQATPTRQASPNPPVDAPLYPFDMPF